VQAATQRCQEQASAHAQAHVHAQFQAQELQAKAQTLQVRAALRFYAPAAVFRLHGRHHVLTVLAQNGEQRLPCPGG
jgi:hypothetical protein